MRVGVGGPVGSGKTTLVEMLCKAMRKTYDLVVVTNDIYTKEDQRLLTVAGALEPERIMGVAACQSSWGLCRAVCTTEGMSCASTDSMRCAAAWPSGTAFMARTAVERGLQIPARVPAS